MREPNSRIRATDRIEAGLTHLRRQVRSFFRVLAFEVVPIKWWSWRMRVSSTSMLPAGLERSSMFCWRRFGGVLSLGTFLILTVYYSFEYFPSSGYAATPAVSSTHGDNTPHWAGTSDQFPPKEQQVRAAFHFGLKNIYTEILQYMPLTVMQMLDSPVNVKRCLCELLHTTPSSCVVPKYFCVALPYRPDTRIDRQFLLMGVYCRYQRPRNFERGSPCCLPAPQTKAT